AQVLAAGQPAVRPGQRGRHPTRRLLLGGGDQHGATLRRRGGGARPHRAASALAGQCRRAGRRALVQIAVSASVETIVVGVDGSEGGAAALEFAAAEAAFRKARLRIVSAWQVPTVAYGSGFTPPLDASTWDAFLGLAQQVADDAFAAAKRLQPSLEAEAL